MCAESDTRLPKKMLHGQVKGRGVVGRPRKIWNDVLLSDTQSLNITSPHSLVQHLQDVHSDAQDKSAWKAKTVIARIIIIINITACDGLITNDILHYYLFILPNYISAVSEGLCRRVVTPLYIGQKSTVFVTMLFYIIGFLDFMLCWKGVKYTTK